MPSLTYWYLNDSDSWDLVCSRKAFGGAEDCPLELEGRLLRIVEDFLLRLL